MTAADEAAEKTRGAFAARVAEGEQQAQAREEAKAAIRRAATAALKSAAAAKQTWEAEISKP